MATSTVTMYGIPNCDTIKKAKRWLEQNGVDYQFHDYRKNGLDKQQLSGWVEQLGWEALLNKRGTTYRQLSDEQKQSIDTALAIELMLEYPAMIKRPLLDTGTSLELGFKAEQYQQLFAN